MLYSRIIYILWADVVTSNESTGDDGDTKDLLIKLLFSKPVGLTHCNRMFMHENTVNSLN